MFKSLLNYSKLLKGFPLIVISLGFLLRVWNFWAALFSSDEALHMTRAVSVARGSVDLLTLNNPSVALKNIFLPILQHNHPPIEFLLTIIAVPLYPREFWARLVYIVISTLFLPFIYLLLLRVINKKFALYFLVLFSTSMFSVWWSRTIGHDILAIIQGTLLGVTIIYFINKPSNRSFGYMLAAITAAFLIIIDFVYYIPLLAYISYRNRKFLTLAWVIKSLLISGLILGLYYIPYIAYSFLPTSSPSTGFNHYLYGNGLLFKKNNVMEIIKAIPLQIKGFYTYFFSLSGVFPAWVFALFSITLIRKKKYISVFFYVMSIYLIINLLFPTTLFFYKDFYGLILILACEWLYSKKRLGYVLLIITILINLLGSRPLFKGVHNEIFNAYYKNDKLDKIGLYSKNCLSGDDSYISTMSSWRTEYYFGRPQLAGLNSGGYTIHDIISRFLEGYYQNDIYLIHYRTGDIDANTENKLHSIAKKEILFGADHAFLFKNCSYKI